METKTILKQFKEKVCEKISLKEKGIGRYLVRTPFIFEDGDNLLIILKYDKEKKKWKLTDEGHTLIHLSYFMDSKDLLKGNRQEIIDNCKKMFEVEEKEGELFIYVEEEKYGDALYNFVQALLKITDVTFLERERVASTFFEDFKSSLHKISKKKKLKPKFNYFVEKDRRREYPIDCRIQKDNKEVFVFAINSDTKCREAIISLLMLERWKIKFTSVGVFEDQSNIGRRVLAKFSNVADKQISSIDNIERFEKYLNTIS